MADKSFRSLNDYIYSLKKHTAGRTALHLRLSCLEKQFLEPYYKQLVGAAINKLKAKYTGENFLLPNADLIVITLDAKMDDFHVALQSIVAALSDSAVIRSLDPMVGQDDRLFKWFDLAESYTEFRSYVADLEAVIAKGGDTAAIGNDQPETQSQWTDTGTGEGQQAPRSDLEVSPETGLLRSTKSVAAKPGIKPAKYTQLKVKRPGASEFDLDPEMLVRLMKQLETTDLEPYVRHDAVEARLQGQPPTPIMAHHYVPIQALLKDLLGDARLKPNRWFYRYMEDQISDRLLASCPVVPRPGDMAGSIRVTTAAISHQWFASFEQSLGTTKRSRVILEFSIFEVMEAVTEFEQTAATLKARGFGLSLADIDIRVLPWLDITRLDVKFLKVEMPLGPVSTWLTDDLRSALPATIKGITKAGVVLSKIDTPAQVELAQELGITLFQGKA